VIETEINGRLSAFRLRQGGTNLLVWSLSSSIAFFTRENRLKWLHRHVSSIPDSLKLPRARTENENDDEDVNGSGHVYDLLQTLRVRCKVRR
jgi:hypothetical protein